MIDIEKAKFDPQSVFDSPEAVADHRALSREQKVEILRRWHYDVVEAQVAQEEGMPSGRNNNDEMLRRIMLALERLTDDGIDQRGPTKHGSLSAPSKKPK